MEKTIMIGGIEVAMKATANTPKRYRNEFNADMLIQMQDLLAHLDDKGAFIGNVDLSVIENVAYIMAKQADENIGTQEEWLDQFGVTDIFDALPAIMSVWQTSTVTLSNAKKK